MKLGIKGKFLPPTVSLVIADSTVALISSWIERNKRDIENWAELVGEPNRHGMDHHPAQLPLLSNPPQYPAHERPDRYGFTTPSNAKAGLDDAEFGKY